MKQVLSIKQMQHLQEMGLNLGETLLYWCRIHDNRPRAATRYGEWTLCKGHSQPTVSTCGWEYIPSYTLQDVLDALPEKITNKRKDYLIEIWKRDGEWTTGYLFFDIEEDVVHLHDETDKSLIDAVYSMLCWAIEQGYVETNKNK